MVDGGSPKLDRHAEYVRLFLDVQPRVYGYIRTLIPQRADAENVLQDTAVVLWEKFNEYQPGTEFLHWAISVARYKVLAFQRDRQRNAVCFSEPLFDVIDAAAAEFAQQSVDLHDAVEACLGKLPDADRELFKRRHSTDITVPKLAAELGRPVTTVYHAIDRIRRALVDCIERHLRKEVRS